MFHALSRQKKLMSILILPLAIVFCLATTSGIAHAAQTVGPSKCVGNKSTCSKKGGPSGGGGNPAAAGTNGCKGNEFFGLIPWWQYLPNDDFDNNCNIVHFDVIHGSDVPLVLLAIVDDLLRIAALVSIGFVIYGAVKYTASQGDPESVAKAQSTVVNALIGLAVAIVSVAFVSFISNRLGG